MPKDYIKQFKRQPDVFVSSTGSLVKLAACDVEVLGAERNAREYPLNTLSRVATLTLGSDYPAGAGTQESINPFYNIGMAMLCGMGDSDVYTFYQPISEGIYVKTGIVAIYF